MAGVPRVLGFKPYRTVPVAFLLPVLVGSLVRLSVVVVAGNEGSDPSGVSLGAPSSLSASRKAPNNFIRVTF